MICAKEEQKLAALIIKRDPCMNSSEIRGRAIGLFVEGKYKN